MSGRSAGGSLFGFGLQPESLTALGKRGEANSVYTQKHQPVSAENTENTAALRFETAYYNFVLRDRGLFSSSLLFVALGRSVRSLAVTLLYKPYFDVTDSVRSAYC